MFAVSALAAFAVALMVQRDMGADFVAVAKITCTETEGLSLQAMDKSATSLERSLTTADVIRAAAGDAGMALESEAGKTTRAPAMTFEDVRNRTSVLRSLDTHGVASVSVSYTGGEQQSTLRLVNALAQQAVRQQQFVSQRTSARAQAAAAAEQAAHAAAQDFVEARRQRDAFATTNEKLLAAQFPMEEPALAPPEQPSDVEREADTAARQKVRQMDSRLEELKGIRRRLLSSMTPEHPHYQLVRDQIAQLQSEIDEVNRTLKPAQPPRPALALDPQAQAARQRQQKLLAELGTLERGVVEAKVRHETLARDAAEARRMVASQLTGDLWRVEAAEVAQRVPRRTTVPSVLIALAIALMAGSATLLIGGAIRTIDRAADVGELLNVKLLGSLPDSGETVAGRTRAKRRPSRFVLTACELTLGLFLVAMAVVALSNRDFAAQIVVDPLSGLAEGVRRLPATFGGPVL